MKSDAWFWVALPVFVLGSGNFTPFRLGPITPISLLIVVYVVLNIRTLLARVIASYLTFGVLALLCFYQAFTIVRLLLEHSGLSADFAGALPYPVYSTMFFARMLISLLFLEIIVEKTPHLEGWALSSMWAILGALFVQIVVQAALFHLGGLKLGYTFGEGLHTRFGGFFGEPQTISAYLFCAFYVLFVHYFPKGLTFTPKSLLLLGIMTFALLLTTSAAWIMAFGLFVFLRLRSQQRVLMIVGAIVLLLTPSIPVFEKIAAEYTTISERSVTVVAGMQVFLSDPVNYIFGYGPGMSPFLIPGAEIFQQYPQFDLTALGRQNVMNSYAELLFECGFIFAALYFLAYLRAAKLGRFGAIISSTPILIGIFSVGGGLYSGYVLFGLAALGIELKRQDLGFSLVRQAKDFASDAPTASMTDR